MPKRGIWASHANDVAKGSPASQAETALEFSIWQVT